MTQVQPGDTIFSYVNQTIAAVAIATTAAFDADRPYEFDAQEMWMKDGWRIDLSQEDVEPPLPLATIIADLTPLLPKKYSPLNRSGGGNQGYLFALPPRAGRLILDAIGRQENEGADPSSEPKIWLDAIAHLNVPSTEREALVKSRIGQGRFRDDLLRLWRGKCAATGVAVTQLLRASHIKPWAASNNQERLDPYNGLLLSPAYDACFDAGLISFDAGGQLIVSSAMTNETLSSLGIRRDARIEGLRREHQNFLAFHRSEVFDKVRPAPAMAPSGDQDGGQATAEQKERLRGYRKLHPA